MKTDQCCTSQVIYEPKGLIFCGKTSGHRGHHSSIVGSTGRTVVWFMGDPREVQRWQNSVQDDGDVCPAVQAAQAASEAVRSLNHLTIQPDGYQYPSDVDSVLGSLHEGAYRMSQAIEQASTWLTAAHRARRIRHDFYGTHAPELGIAVGEATDDLWEAARRARDLSASLDSARQATSHFAGVDPPTPT